MSSLFLSHSSHDKAVAERLRSVLVELGFADVFLDNHSILPGQQWEPVLYERLRQCQAVVALYSPRFMASKWCFAELTHARSLGRPIVPVRMEPCEVPAFLQDYQVQELEELGPSAIERIRAGLEKVLVRPNDRFEPDFQRPPYPGLASFEVEDAGVYFGRESDIQRGLDQFHDLAVFGGGATLLILGASGVGKSSLLRAGLTARLLREPKRWTIVGPMRPREEPLVELARAIVRSQSRLTNTPRSLDEIYAQLGDKGTPLKAIQSLEVPQYPDARPVLIIDQLEELLSTRKNAREHFISWLTHALSSPGRPLLLLGSLRSDYLADFEEAMPLAALGVKHLSIGALQEVQLLRSIVRPAEDAGASFENGLAHEILTDIRDRQALPLLAFTLRALWDRRAPGERLSLHTYTHELERVQGAIRRAAEAAGGGALHRPQWKSLQRTLLRLVKVGTEGKVLRCRVRRSELPSESAAQVSALVEARLLVVDGEHIEVAHEAIFEAWEQFRTSISESQEALIALSEIEADAARWKKADGLSDYLWPRARLERAAELLKSAELEPNREGKAFMAAAWELVQQRERKQAEEVQQQLEAARNLAREAQKREIAEADRARAARKVSQILFVSAVALLATLGVIAVVARQAQQQRELAEQGQQQAQRERDNARSRELTTRALLELKKDPKESLNLITEAWKLARTEDISLALSEWRREPGIAVLRGHSRPVRAVAFSPDGSRLITTSSDGAARLWEAVSGRLLATLEGNASSRNQLTFDLGGPYQMTARVVDPVSNKPVSSEKEPLGAVAFSPDGSRLITAGYFGTAILWDAASFKPLATLKGHEGPVTAVAFIPNSSRVFTAGFDGTARIWSAISGEPLVTLRGHSGPINAAAFSPDGASLITGGSDSSARLWATGPGKPLAILRGHIGAIYAVAFSSKGTHVATAGEDSTVRLWEPSSGKLLAILSGHSGPAESVVFSPEGARLVSAGSDGTTRLWDVASGKPLTTLYGHSGPVKSMAYSPDGLRLVTASEDGTARLWDAATGKLLATFQGHSGAIRGVAFSPDGSRIATASFDGTARTWGDDHDKAAVLLVGHSGSVRALAFSPDGSHLASASADGTARLWQVTSGKPLATLQGHAGELFAVTFSSDGSRIATAGRDGTARLWEVPSGKPLATFKSGLESIEAVAFSADGRSLLTADIGGSLQAWEIASRKLLVFHQRLWRVSYRVTFSPGGSRVAASQLTGNVLVLEVPSGKILASLHRFGWSKNRNAVAFSHDGTLLSTVGLDGIVHRWDASSGGYLSGFAGSPGWMIAANADDSRLATADSIDDTVKIWEPSGKQLATIRGHFNNVTAIAFSPDGSRLATADKDGTLRIWSCWIWEPIESQLEKAAQLEAGQFPTCAASSTSSLQK